MNEPSGTKQQQQNHDQPHNPAQGHNIAPDNKTQNQKLKEHRAPVLNREDQPSSDKNKPNERPGQGIDPSSL